jgi:ribonuclease VapC
MIVVDASAALAIVLNEDDETFYATTISDASVALISVASVLECSMKVQRRHGKEGEVGLNHFLEAAKLQICEIDLAQLAAARAAFGTYGKGMGHRAQLNFGDCFSYALAKTRNFPLLFKGNDFSQTDIAIAT